MIPAAFHRALLRLASVMVPATSRTDWLGEWRSELWHVRREPRGMNVTAFCLGAFRDAFWLRRNRSGDEPVDIALSSPLRCLSFLAALGALCVVGALFLPGARMILRGSLYPRDLVMLSPADRGDPSIQNGFFDPYPTVSRRQFDSLKAQSASQFTGLAFYVQTRMGARTTAALFRVVNEAGRQNLPGSGDGWLIEDEAAFAALPGSTLGFVVGRLRYGTLDNSQFRFIRLRDRSLGIFSAVLVALAFACVFAVFMPAGSSGGHPRRIGARRGLFLAAKALLVLPIVLFGSLDLASVGGSLSPVYFDLALFGSVFAVRWINADQRKRCPVCLRLLANPVRIGESSRILLEWHGTELMCLRGHGLLYVPEWPAIWSGQQRWLDLGPSWGGLFP
jgi:hypothetical protein